MADQRALDAINRIERALARIETGARNPAPAEALQRVRAAHLALRSRVEGAISQIDHLIETEAR